MPDPNDPDARQRTPFTRPIHQGGGTPGVVPSPSVVKHADPRLVVQCLDVRRL